MRSEGRRRINSLNVAPIRQTLERWINKYEAYWTNTLLRVKEAAEDEAQNTPRGRKRGKRTGWSKSISRAVLGDAMSRTDWQSVLQKW
mgnify:CR=1 FL=1